MCSDKIFGKTFVEEKTMADFINLKTFLEGNILGVKSLILDFKKTKLKKKIVSSPLTGANLRKSIRPGPPSFYLEKSFRAIYFLLCQYFDLSSYIDLKCLLCVYVPIDIQFDNTSTCK